jgi:hypothetical protein
MKTPGDCALCGTPLVPGHHCEGGVRVDGSTWKRIPIAAGRRIAEQYGYDQVVIIARKVGEGGVEYVTTYGVDKANCAVAAKIGDFIKHKIMRWPEK